MGLEEWEKASESERGEGFARCSTLPASPCNNRMDSRCQNDKQMDCHNLIKMLGIQKRSHCCIICGSYPSASPKLQNRPQSIVMSY